MRRLLLILIAACLLSCENTNPQPTEQWHSIAGRTEDQYLIYTSVVPAHWQRLSPESSLDDTMKPICEYRIENDLRLVVHNFPSDTLSQRIPPQAQVRRWQRQSGEGVISNECHNGFIGLRFEANNVLAWAMQLDPEHYLALTGPQATIHDRQRRADYTIKVMGPQDLIESHRQDLETFAQRFEIIEPILTDS